MTEYSCISFAGVLTLFTHGVMLTSAVVLIATKEHSFTGIDSLGKLLSPAVPVLAFSLPVNLVNFVFDADYMFFKCDSFFLKPIGDALPDLVTVIIMYLLYILLMTLPYLPSYIRVKKEEIKNQ